MTKGGGVDTMLTLPRLQFVFHKLHDPTDKLKGGILAVQVLPNLIALLALGFLAHPALLGCGSANAGVVQLKKMQTIISVNHHFRTKKSV